MIYKSAGLIALPHPSPSHPVHIMLVPRQPIATSANLDTEHGALLVEVHRAAAQIALQLGLEGYRLIINNGSYQDVDQLHFHLISGPPA
jgi:histidine triad (HIT) family protein